MTDSNRPRHALDDAEDSENLGLPLRGLAMILIAVAVLLIGWAAYSLTGKDSDVSNRASQSQQTSQAQNQPGKAPSNEQGSRTPGGPESDKPKPEDEQAGRENASADGRQEGEANPAEGGVNKENTYVAVLNNSPIAGLAGDVANKMRDQQWSKTGVGNLPDESGVFPTSVVLYSKGNDAERQLAEQLAKDLGISSRERDEVTDRTLTGVTMLEGERPAGVVVVTTNDMPR